MVEPDKQDHPIMAIDRDGLNALIQRLAAEGYLVVASMLGQ